jgi:hypothetical protein
MFCGFLGKREGRGKEGDLSDLGGYAAAQEPPDLAAFASTGTGADHSDGW